MRRFIVIVAALGCCFLPGVVLTENQEAAPEPLAAAPQERGCAACHTCPNPTKESPCLVPCPRLATDQGPDVVLLDQLSEQYVPVIFAHKLHAQMTKIVGGCELCHHNHPPGRIVPCRDCHPAASPSPDFAQPGLKGAYHRQCLNCHREWSHETECAVCHAKRAATTAAVHLPDPSDIMGVLHPNVEEPVQVVFETTHEEGRLVTFRHQEHVERFGFKCVDCHREEGCSRCHDPKNRQHGTQTLEEHHRPCAICHEGVSEEKQACQHCHSESETPPFDHASTGWPLSRYHQPLNCRSCHKAQWRFAPLEPDCLSCHQDWSPGKFDHAVTGQLLNENHVESACTDCHLEGKFDRPPSCAECHEEDIQFPAKRPGDLVTPTPKP